MLQDKNNTNTINRSVVLLLGATSTTTTLLLLSLSLFLGFLLRINKKRKTVMEERLKFDQEWRALEEKCVSQFVDDEEELRFAAKQTAEESTDLGGGDQGRFRRGRGFERVFRRDGIDVKDGFLGRQSSQTERQDEEE